MSRILSILALLATSGLAANPDMCTALKSTSFCMDSGFCSDTDRRLTCREAYIRISEGLLRPNSEPPILSKLPTAFSEFTMFARGEKRMQPDPHAQQELYTNPSFPRFSIALVEFHSILTNRFPYIRYESGELHQELLLAASQLQNLTKTVRFRSAIMSLSLVNSISAQIRIYIEFISSLSRTDPLRIAIFAHLIPFVHAWMTLHALFVLPPPLLPLECLEFLTTASQYDPLYTESGKTWLSSLPQIGREFRNSPIVPFIDQFETIPLPVYDYLGIPTDGMNMTLMVETIIDRLDPRNKHNQWLSIMFLANHPNVTNDLKGRFCRSFMQRTNNRIPFFSDGVHRELDFKNLEGVLDLYRLCGDTVVSFAYRTGTILPLLFRRSNLTTTVPLNRVDNYTAILRIPIQVFRHTLRLSMVGVDSSEMTSRDIHVDFLTSFLRIPSASAIRAAISTHRVFTQKEKFVPEVLGRIIALLLLEGDPTGILRYRFPTLMFDSVSGISGFCKVINCVAFRTLFTLEEIPRVLDYLAARSVGFIPL
jgi:hypothetical protein